MMPAASPSLTKKKPVARSSEVTSTGSTGEFKIGTPGMPAGLNTKPLFKLMVDRKASDLFFTANAPIKMPSSTSTVAAVKPIRIEICPP